MADSEKTPEPFVSPGFTRPDNEGPETNANACTVVRTVHFEYDRYQFDMGHCKGKDWECYDTNQDAWYFGIWVRRSTREIVTYAEGEITHVTAPTEEAFTAELASMAEFFGPPPPAFKMITGAGELVEVTGARPGEPGPTGTELLAQALSD